VATRFAKVGVLQDFSPDGSFASGCPRRVDATGGAWGVTRKTLEPGFSLSARASRALRDPGGRKIQPQKAAESGCLTLAPRHRPLTAKY